MILNWSKEGEPLIPGQEPVLANGVRGCAFDMPNGIYIPMIAADKPGSGDVGRFLDALPKDRRVVFPTVISQELAGMLKRRKFTEKTELTEFGPVRVWERGP